MAKRAAEIKVTNNEQKVLEDLVASKKIERRCHQRAEMILLASMGKRICEIIDKIGVKRDTVMHWCEKWKSNRDKLDMLSLEYMDKELPKKLIEFVKIILSDESRPGAPATFTSEQICRIVALGCESPELNGYPVTHWSNKLLAEEAIRKGIVASISQTQVGRFLKSGGFTTP